MRIWLVISVFVYLLLWRPLVLGSGVPPTVVLVPLAVGLAQRLRYISVWRSDTSGPQRYAGPPPVPGGDAVVRTDSCVPCGSGGWSPAPRWGGTPASRSRDLPVSDAAGAACPGTVRVLARAVVSPATAPCPRAGRRRPAAPESVAR